MNFALLTCPHSPDQIRAVHPRLKWLPKSWLPDLTRFLGVSVRGNIELPKLTGCVLDFPLMPGQLGQAEKKAAQAAKKIANAGAKVVGLEAGLRSLAPVFVKHGLAVSYGSAMQVAAAISVLLSFFSARAGEVRALIVNPVTPPGGVCALLLAAKVRHLTLMGNFPAPMQRMARRIVLETGTAPVLTKVDPDHFARADLVIDLAGLDLNLFIPARAAVVWQPWTKADYSGQGRVISEAVIGLDSGLQFEGDLPAGLLRASTAEAILQGMGIERLWPRTSGEVTVDQVLRICALANRIELPIAGYINRNYLSLFAKKIGFDK